MNKNAYQSRGVSATKDEVHEAIKDLDRGPFGGAFCKVVEDPMGDPDYCAAMHADGAGTKSALAYIKYKETGDTSAFYGIAQDSTVMNLDDLLCIGATGGFVMSNTIGRNAHRVPGEGVKAIISGYADFVKKLEGYGVDVNMCGGETADVGDLVQTVIADSTFFVRLKRSDLINCDNIRPGDVIVGLASYGQANYEDSYNAGMGSNGLTAARHLLLGPEYREKYPETYSSTIDKELVYCGKYSFTDPLPGTDVAVGDAILSPTRTYAPIVKELLDGKADADKGGIYRFEGTERRQRIHGMIHCTGGGQGTCGNFGIGIHYIKDNLFPRPALFEAIAQNGDIGEKEMYQVFNMGHRMEIYCDESDAASIIALAESFGVEAKIVGRTEASADGRNHVTVRDRGNEYTY